MPSTASASRPSTVASRPFRSLSAATCGFATAPNITRLYIHSVYAAPRTMVLAARKASQKPVFIAPRITRNSPTKPLVAGRPLFAMANSIIRLANFGIVFTTPP